MSSAEALRKTGLVGTVLMAAGPSRRLVLPRHVLVELPPSVGERGYPKQLLPLGDRPLLQVTLDAYRAAATRPIVLVLGHGAERIVRHLRLPPSGVRVVVNPDYEAGQSTSLRLGLRTLRQPGPDGTPPPLAAALFALGDQPLIRPSTINRLIQAYRASEARIVVPTYRGRRGNPTLMDHSLFDAVAETRGDKGARDLLREYRRETLRVPVDDPGVKLDVDRWGQYRYVRRQYERGRRR